jgi:nodulation protein E
MNAMWDALAAGRSGIRRSDRADFDSLQIRSVAAVEDFDPEAHFDAKVLPILDRYAQFALVAAREAVAQSGLDFSDGLSTRTAVITGAGSGGMTTVDAAYKRLYEDGKLRVFPLTVPRLMVSAASSHITMAFGIRGPAYTISSACSSANHAIGEAVNMIRYGRVEAAITGGAEACLTLGVMGAWQSLRVMATDTCRPFSVNRKGMVLGEGAGMFVLETLDAAQARGADILAEIVGFGMTSDAGDIVQPSLDGVCGAISAALDDAGLAPDAVDYVNAHGTGTDINDVVETAALHRVLGDHAKSIAVSSTKSMHGHALGAAGALELAATLKAIEHQTAPPTANFTQADPKCDLDYVPNTAREMTIDTALSNSFAFGGLNAVLAIKRVA